MNKILAKLLTCMIRDKKLRKERRRDLIEDRIYPEDIKLIMTLVVKNEEEIIEKNIRFHHAMGVDGFIVTNHNSTDKTLEILNMLKNEGLIYEIITETSIQHKHNVWVDKMIRLAKQKYKANWVINADADEFYYSKDLNLKQSIVKFPKLNVIKVESTFSFPTNKENIFDNVFFITNPVANYKLESLDKSNEFLKNFSLDGTRSCPKVIHKTSGYKMINEGNHDVRMRKPCKGNNVDIVLYHYHTVNYRRYAEKAKRWAEAGKYLTEGENYLTKMTSLLENNKLMMEYNKIYGGEIQEKLENLGIISKDFSVFNFLKYKGILK